MYIEYRSISDLNDCIVKNLAKIPHDIDLVVGIPRSGMLPANLLALYLNKPYTDIDSFVEGRVFSGGERTKVLDDKKSGKILVVDDSINEGTALTKAKAKLDYLAEKYELIYAVVYATSLGSKKVDCFLELIDGPRVFQWNMFHHKYMMGHACCDIDGVLCLNPPIDDDGPLYKEYIEHATPYIIPRVKIDTLVSCRLEKYRAITEKWLAEHEIQYNNLVMLPFSTKEERIAWGKHGEYKGKVFKKHKDDVIFIESSLKEAVDIAKTSGKQVFCTENFRMIYPDSNFMFRQKRWLSFKVFVAKCLSKIGIKV